jgi:hypothetical protein
MSSPPASRRREPVYDSVLADGSTPPDPVRTVTLSCSVPMGDVQFGASTALPLAEADDEAIDAALDVLEAAAARIVLRVDQALAPATPVPPPEPDTPAVMPFDWRDPLTGVVYERGQELAAVPTPVLRRLYPVLRYETPRRAVALALQQRGGSVPV